MQGDNDVLKLLNEQLTNELTAINQYFLHSKMQHSWGFTEIAKHTRAGSMEKWSAEPSPTASCCSTVCRTTRGSDRCASDRRSASTVRERSRDRIRVVARLRPGSSCAGSGRTRQRRRSSRRFLPTRNSIDYLETQLQLMSQLGEQLYCAQCVSRPPS